MASRHRGDFTRGHFSTYQGTNQTIKQLREIGEHVVTAAKEALKEGVDDLVTDIKHREPRRTGKLEEAVKAISRKKGAEYNIEANAPALNKRGIPYAQFVEFDPRIGGNPQGGKILYPTFEKHAPLIHDKIREAIRKASGGK